MKRIMPCFQFEPSMAEETVITLAVSLINKLSSLSFPETERWRHVKANLDKVKITVSEIIAKLPDAEERSATFTFRAWLEKLKDTLYDANKLLDDLSFYCSLRFCYCSLMGLNRLASLRNRLTSLESELNYVEDLLVERRQQGHFFVHKDEEQSVIDHCVKSRLKVQKDSENILVDSFMQACHRSKMKPKEKMLVTYPFQKMGYGIARFERQSCLYRFLYPEITITNLLSSMSNGSMKRNRKFVSDDLLRQERESKRKQRQLRFREESLTSQLQRKSKRKEGLLKKWGSAQKIAKIYHDRTERRINNNGKITDSKRKLNWKRKLEGMKKMVTEASQYLDDDPIVTKITGTKASQQILCYIDRIKMQWPMQSDLLVIKQEIQEIDRKYKDSVLAEDEAKWRLLLVGEKIEELDRQQSEFYFASPWLEKATAIDDRVSKFCDLENQLYNEDNNKVEYKDFLGLEQALKKTAWGKTPDYLQPIAIRIEKARGKATDVFHIPAQVPVCAAIKEMEDLPVGDLDWSTLKKWGATLNYAKKYGFQVGFADNLLKKNLLAYFAIQNLPNSTAKN